MNVIDKILTFDDHWSPEEADLSSSQIASSSNYQLWLHKQGTPKNVPVKLEDRVNAVIGTGFHMRAEQALEDVDCITEHRMLCDIAGVKVSGTADLIYDNGFVSTVGDFKTMGAFSFIMLLNGKTENYIKQLSIYAYMYAKEIGNDMETTGEIYAFRTGDNKYLSKAQKEKFPYGLPRYATVMIDLLEESEVEEMVLEAYNPTNDSADSCPTYNDKGVASWWRCSWCEYECKHRKEKK